MKILSPPGLAYPIIVKELKRQRDDEVRRSDPLFEYLYDTWVEEGDRVTGEVKQVEKRWRMIFQASVDGTINKWYIKLGGVIKGPGELLLDLEEPCTHETQFGGLCVECGKDMTEVDYLTKDLDSDRATVNMTHDNIALLVSQKEASRAEEDSKRRLLNAKKLSLIVDLDQTVIHTTCERTIAEWKDDPNNPNYEALKDVVGFQLADDNVAHVAANWYYVKMRPGLQDFLEEMSQLYEMHVYTMATRAYAQAVAKIIDPERKYFGDRILSRDENYTDKLKSLHRLFPNNTDMAVIIDDRADIWGYSENLVRVPVFNFFPGAGDINASFLPKQQELVSQAPKPKVAEVAPAAVTETETGDEASEEPEDEATVLSVAASPIVITPAEPLEPVEPANGVENDLEHKLLAMGAAESHEKLEEQAKEQEKVIIAQQTERPLLQAQLELDKEDGLDPDALHREADDTTEPVENGHSQSGEHHKHRHSLLNNDDRGIEVIAANLRLVHQTFYDEYRKAAPQGGRVAELKGEKSPKKRIQEDVVPDVAEIMSRIKSEVLDGYVIVFSGIIPLGVNVQNSDYALWATSFGAKIATEVTKYTTHVIANPDRKTTKVKKAARFPHIEIVNAEWLFQACTRWEFVEERPYRIELDEADRSGSPVEQDDSVNVSGGEGDAEPEEPVAALSDDQWKSMDDELADFLNESDTEDTSASESESGASTDSTSKRKRKRGTESDENSEEDDSDASTSSASKLQRRKRRTMDRVSTLHTVVNAEKSSGLPSPETTGPEEEQGEDDGKTFDPQGQGGDLDESDYDDGLEAEMMAQFEKSDSEVEE